MHDAAAVLAGQGQDHGVARDLGRTGQGGVGRGGRGRSVHGESIPISIVIWVTEHEIVVRGSAVPQEGPGRRSWAAGGPGLGPQATLWHSGRQQRDGSGAVRRVHRQREQRTGHGQPADAVVGHRRGGGPHHHRRCHRVGEAESGPAAGGGPPGGGRPPR
ncbi:hypothetical protein ACFFX0_28690 [Citricoccus parietis]|uniref:Uncharacterized protein n=1 Tax=Citricoccus parietis TaxID=592307 RepID=A0ABV5G7M4_9MICC